MLEGEVFLFWNRDQELLDPDSSVDKLQALSDYEGVSIKSRYNVTVLQINFKPKFELFETWAKIKENLTPDLTIKKLNSRKEFVDKLSRIESMFCK